MWPAPGWTVTRGAADRPACSDGLWWNAMFVNAFRDPELNKRISAALVDYAEGRDHPRNDGECSFNGLS